MTARFVDLDTGSVRQTSDAEFFRAVFGKSPQTKAEREGEYRAKLERYADYIERGDDWGVPCPYLRDARAVVAERKFQRRVETDLLRTMELESCQRIAVR